MTFLLSPVARYLAGAAALCLLVAYWLHQHDAHVRAGIEQKYSIAAAKAEKVHQLELKNARDAKEKADSDLAVYVTANPIRPVFLCYPTKRTPAFQQTSASPGPGPADVQPLHEGDPVERAGDTDISGLLSAFAASADAVSNDLREQQAVK